LTIDSCTGCAITKSLWHRTLFCAQALDIYQILIPRIERRKVGYLTFVTTQRGSRVLGMNMTGGNHEGAEPPRRLPAAVALVDEAHALSYALVRVLASSPRDELSREDLDALCQLAYELLNKLTKAQEFFQAIDKSSDI
jgi:hypothetical protein